MTVNPLTMSGYELILTYNLIASSEFEKVVKYDQTIKFVGKEHVFADGKWGQVDKEFEVNYLRVKDPLETGRFLYCLESNPNYGTREAISKHHGDTHQTIEEVTALRKGNTTGVRDVESPWGVNRVRRQAWLVYDADPTRFEELYKKHKIEAKSKKKDEDRSAVLAERKEKKIEANKFTVASQQQIANEMLFTIFPRGNKIVTLAFGGSAHDPTGKTLYDALEELRPELHDEILEKLRHSPNPDIRRFFFTYLDLDPAVGLLDKDEFIRELAKRKVKKK